LLLGLKFLTLNFGIAIRLTVGMLEGQPFLNLSEVLGNLLVNFLFVVRTYCQPSGKIVAEHYSIGNL
jgi:hypothetical protein